MHFPLHIIILLTTLYKHLTDGLITKNIFFQIPKQNTKPSSSSSSHIRMALTPIGPFCPFRSPTSISLNSDMEHLTLSTPQFALEMSRLQLDMQMGNDPQPDRLRSVADGIENAVMKWEDLLQTLQSSIDFQTREYAKLTQVHLENQGQTSEEVADMMRWQADCMRAMAEGDVPPLPPRGMDVLKMMEDARLQQEKQQEKQQQQQQSKDDDDDDESVVSTAPNLNAMMAAQRITSTPFTGKEQAFKTDTVRLEYETLVRDHSNLIEMGGMYGNFDPLGKLSFLGEMDKISDRWDVFFARFKLLGELNMEYVDQCNAFLKSMNLDEGGYRSLLEKTREGMMLDAEKERNF